MIKSLFRDAESLGHRSDRFDEMNMSQHFNQSGSHKISNLISQLGHGAQSFHSG